MPLNFILTHENINKMINLNVIKKAMFLLVKDKKLSLSNSAPWQNVERFHEKKAKLLLRMPSRQSIFRVYAYPYIIEQQLSYLK